MKWTGAVAASLLGLAASSAIDVRDVTLEQRQAMALAAAAAVAKRAEPNSPSGGYAPWVVDCPAQKPTVREASSLSPNETAWLEKRRNNTITPMTTLLSRANISDFDAASYIQSVQNNASALPNIGIAVSGGGYRALMNGAGFLAAADDRTGNATGAGNLGGLLQSATYLAGLSGGGWLVGSLYMNNFSTIVNLRDGSPDSDVWEFQNSIFTGPDEDGISILDTGEYYYDILDDVDDKDNKGFEITITDYWGRALAYQLINDTDGGVKYTFSSIQLADNFINGEIPMPILVSDERTPGDQIVSLNSTLHEFNPWELGSWDPTLFGFVPLEFTGTNFTAGEVTAGDRCVRGFDNAGYVMGTSSTLFNTFLLYSNSTGLPQFLVNALDDVLTDIGDDNDDIAAWKPNPFYQYNPDINRSANQTQLTLVDGGEDLQNIPLVPLIQPLREVDVIFAVDSSADNTYNWPNGTSMVATYQRNSNATIMNGTSFPSVPDQNTFVNLGLNKRPTFFGCDVNNQSTYTPLIVYIPNAPYVTHSNVSTFDPSYNTTQRDLIIQNGYDVATMGNGTIDNQWPTCVACAILSRSFWKTGTDVPSDCNTCFERYCWDGTLNSTEPSEPYAPEFLLAEVSMGGASMLGLSKAAYVAVGLTATLLMM